MSGDISDHRPGYGGDRARQAYADFLRDQGNPNHDPQTGQFSSGEGGSGAVTHDQHLARLHAAGTDPAAFAAAIETVQALPKAQVEALAVAYVRGRDKYATKGEALAAMKTAFIGRAFQATKMQQVGKSGYGGYGI